MPVVKLTRSRSRPIILVAAFCELVILPRICLGQASSFDGPCSQEINCRVGGKCVEDPFKACFNYAFPNGDKSVSTCFNITTSKDVSKPGCIGVPRPVPGVMIAQSRNPDNRSVSVNVSWTEIADALYVGPSRYVILLEGYFQNPKDTLLHYSILSDQDVNYKIHDNIQGGWNYNVYVATVTAAGQSPTYGPISIKADDTIPKMVTNLKVVQDARFASEMDLTFQCPQVPSGVITAFFVRKTITVGNTNTSTEYLLPSDGRCNMIHVQANQVGGIQPMNEYFFEVKIRNAHFDGEYSNAVRLFTSERKPHLEPMNGDSDYVKAAKIITSFTLHLCSSCLENSDQGQIQSAALIICIKTDKNKCLESDINSQTMQVKMPDDIKLLHTWAYAKAHKFNVPYRTTADDFHEHLQNDNGTDFLYTVGDSYCDESDNQTFCDGPLPENRNFVVTAIVCNNIGCDAKTFTDEKFTTVQDSDSNQEALYRGLLIGFGVVLLVSICVIIFLVLAFRKKSSRIV